MGQTVILISLFFYNSTLTEHYAKYRYSNKDHHKTNGKAIIDSQWTKNIICSFSFYVFEISLSCNNGIATPIIINNQ